MAKKRKKNPIRGLLSPGKLLIPIGIGLSVVGYMLYTSFDIEVFSKMDWTYQTLAWLVVAMSMMLVRDAAYIYRIKVLANQEYTWKQAIRTIFLWEFASAATPSIVGGAPIAIFILNKEGINLGKSTAIVLITAFMDELFFLTVVPIIFFLVQQADLFPQATNILLFGKSLSPVSIFWTSYGIIAFYCMFIAFGLFISPKGLKKLLSFVFQISFLNKWKEGAERTGDEMIMASAEIKQMSFSYWVKTFIATYFAWTARYWVINFLILSVLFTDQHLLIYGRQLVMWIIMLISPTPGGSGIAEIAFSKYFSDFIPIGFESALALAWRLISYYPYLIIGVIILPQWVKRVYLKRKLIKFKSN